MAVPIPSHQCTNHERTDDVLTNLHGLAFALEALHHAHYAPEPNSPEGVAKDTVLRLLVEQCDAVNKVRLYEWVGTGGARDGLTSDEAAIARGEPRK